MLNRRSFFKVLGSAVLGTAIALKIPDSILPTPQLVDDLVSGQLTYSKLLEAYNSVRAAKFEPNIIVANKATINFLEKSKWFQNNNKRNTKLETYGDVNRNDYSQLKSNPNFK